MESILKLYLDYEKRKKIYFFFWLGWFDFGFLVVFFDFCDLIIEIDRLYFFFIFLKYIIIGLIL